MAANDSPPLFRSSVSVRLARPADRDPVLAFCATTWDFGDYIDHVWDRWLNDPRSDLLVGVDERDHPIALGHARLVAPGEAWLEGLRVDPAVRRQGIAEVMCRAAVEAAERRGARWVRFATLATNTPVHRLVPRLGFRKIAGFVAWGAPAADATKGGAANPMLVPVEGSDLATAGSAAAGTDSVRTLAGLAVSGWTYARLTPDRLREWTAGGGRLYRLAGRSPGAAFAWVDSSEDPAANLSVPWIAAAGHRIEVVCRALRRLAAAANRPGVDLRLPEGDAFAGGATTAGFVPVEDFAFWIYEYQSGRFEAANSGEPE